MFGLNKKTETETIHLRTFAYERGWGFYMPKSFWGQRVAVDIHKPTNTFTIYQSDKGNSVSKINGMVAFPFSLLGIRAYFGGTESITASYNGLNVQGTFRLPSAKVRAVTVKPEKKPTITRVSNKVPMMPEHFDIAEALSQINKWAKESGAVLGVENNTIFATIKF